jgi:hypothetical protein
MFSEAPLNTVQVNPALPQAFIKKSTGFPINAGTSRN